MANDTIGQIYVPTLRNYKPMYIQTDSDTAAVDTRAWGLVAKTNPYPLLPNPKEPFQNDWKDENGNDEYVAEMYYEAMEFSVTFYIKAFATQTAGAEKVLRTQIDSFFDAIREGEFMLFDSYTGLGRQRVRYAGYEEESFKAGEGWARSIFTITFKANDPITRVILSNNTLVAE